MLRNPAASLHCDLSEGQIGNVKNELGEKLVKLGLAEPVSEPSKQQVKREKTDIQAVPSKPSVAKAETKDLHKEGN